MAKKLQAVARSVEQAIGREGEAVAARPSRRDLLSTGSTLLNLACSGNPFGGFLKGKYYWIVGDSTSGKTFLSMSCFAEATQNRHFRDYRLIYDNVEDGMLMDLTALFGSAVAALVEPPARNEDSTPRHSSTIEEFYYNVDDAEAVGTPFIYVLDSMDGLDSKAAQEKFKEQKEAYLKDGETAGSYGDGKAKQNSGNLRGIVNRLRDTGSILIIVSQTRDNLGMGHDKKTSSGGKALKFYATVELWSSVAGQIKKAVQGKDRIVGTSVKIKVKKNRITGKSCEVGMDIYPSYGIDDIGSMIDYLVDEKHWTKAKQSIIASEFDLTATRDKLVAYIEKNDQVDNLRALVGDCWNDIEASCALQRKKRYD